VGEWDLSASHAKELSLPAMKVIYDNALLTSVSISNSTLCSCADSFSFSISGFSG
jgi:hypothetical protein